MALCQEGLVITIRVGGEYGGGPWGAMVVKLFSMSNKTLWTNSTFSNLIKTPEVTELGVFLSPQVSEWM